MRKVKPRTWFDVACLAAGFLGITFGVYEHYAAVDFQSEQEKVSAENDDLRKERARIIDMCTRALDRLNKYNIRADEGQERSQQ